MLFVPAMTRPGLLKIPVPVYQAKIRNHNTCRLKVEKGWKCRLTHYMVEHETRHVEIPQSKLPLGRIRDNLIRVDYLLLDLLQDCR